MREHTLVADQDCGIIHAPRWFAELRHTLRTLARNGDLSRAGRGLLITPREATLYKQRLEFIKNLSLKAGQLTLEGFGRCDQISKDGHDGYDIATEYDLRTEDLVKSQLLKEFGEPVLGEEDGLIGDHQRAKSSLWIVDPIDGTFNYQRGLPLYGVSIAYCEESMPVCGAVYLPALDQLFFAAEGSGAFLSSPGIANPIPIHVGRERELARLIISLAGRDTYQFIAACAAEGVPWRSIRFLLCAVASIVYIASGRMDVFADTALGLWDCAAGDIILQEAGGPATVDYQGVPVFPEYVNRRLDLDDTRKFSLVAASSPELLQEPMAQLLAASDSRAAR
jgi:myo-inositol-1(or 4)-monophosphatase